MGLSKKPAATAPRSGLSRRELSATISSLPIVDVHEHHFPGVFLNRNVGLLDLFRQSYAGWTQPGGMDDRWRQRPTTWESLQPFVEKSGSNAFVRNLISGLRALYDSNLETLTAKNWKKLDAEVRRRHRDPSWTKEVLKRAGVDQIITDVYVDPLLDARGGLGPGYHSVFRINAFAMGWHPNARDHNGNSSADLARRLGLKFATFRDLERAMEFIVASMAERHQVGLKNALAYDRSIDFDEPDLRLAKRAWGKATPSAAEQKAFGDFVVDRFCRLAGEAGLPMQMHLGTARIRGSNPMNAAGLIERHPGTRFLLMHLAYPWSSELLALAFTYRNIWLDLTWSFLLSPSHCERVLDEAIEILPDESRMMFGGDNWHVEETYASLQQARRMIGDVLDRKVERGYFTALDAKRLAEKMFFRNAREFFRLDAAAR